MDLSPFAGLLVATAIGAFLATVTWLFSRAAGLSPIQANLISNLKDDNAVLREQRDNAVAERDSERARWKACDELADQQRDLIVDLQAEAAALRKRLGER